MTDRDHPEGVTELVDALLLGYAPISVLLDHMFSAPSHPTVEQVRATVGPLLYDTLEPLAMTHGPGELLTSAAIVEATVPLIHEGFLLVPHNPTSRGGRRKARRR
jgi:hypothetical protein